jgi:predicted transcriptional regulator of viral defense system
MSAVRSRVNRRRALAQLAGDRGGVFTASGARSIGVASNALAYYTQTGTIERLSRGVYRLADYPSTPHERLAAAAAALGPDAVVSHESALQLHGVSDVSPSHLHFTLPRARRYAAVPSSDVEIHTTTRPFRPGEVVQYEGFRATSLARSIVDCARTHTAPEQIAMALSESLRRGYLTRSEIDAMARNATARVRSLICRALPE